MDYKFLNKVADQIVGETRVGSDDYIYPPFIENMCLPLPTHLRVTTPSSFYYHCEDVYGLNSEEIKYVWDQYKIILLKLKKNG
jgi:hypothetical protein